MDTQPGHHVMHRREIHFPHGTLAQAVLSPKGTSATELASMLDIARPRVVILIAGGAGHMEKTNDSSLRQLFTNGLVRVAAALDALIIDGGTHAGVMALMGQGIAEQPRKPVLLGVSPAGRVSYPGDLKSNPLENAGDTVPLDPNHSHFVLVETDEWGGETATMYELATLFSAGCRCVYVLVYGGSITKNEVLWNVRQGRPVIVIEGSGRLADEIARIRHERSAAFADPVLNEIMAHGDLHLFPLAGSAQELAELMLRLLQKQ